MALCLLIGNVLMVAITASNPLYSNAVLQKTLTPEFKPCHYRRWYQPNRLYAYEQYFKICGQLEQRSDDEQHRRNCEKSF